MEKERKNNPNNIIENKYLYSYIEENEEIQDTRIFVKNNFLYGWGKNKYGELGVGHNENLNEPSPIKSLQNQIITEVSSGGKHTAVLTKAGAIYICGTDVLGLLGTETKKWKEQHKFQILSSLDFEFVTQIACAEFHSLCLTKDGHVYAWGGNLHNKLGQQNQAGIPSRIKSLLNKKIISISCGDYHSTALAETGEVFSWGGGGQYNRGQCGHGDLKEVEAPKRIEFFKNKKVNKVVCGGYHTIVLTEDNNLYGFGKGSYGQCGYGVAEDTAVPKLIKFPKKSVFYEQNVVNKFDLTYNNFNEESVIASALNQVNLANSNISSNEYKSPVIVKDIKCGGEHTMILSSFGRVYTFGHGYTGQLGQGNSKNYDRPMIVKSLIKKTVNQIAAGWSHSMILTSEGNLYISGCGKYGEIGLKDNENRKHFTLIRSASRLNITNIYAGGHHSWLVTDNITPERDDFEVPSPLNSGNFSPNFPKSVDNSPRNIKKDNSSNKLINLNKVGDRTDNNSHNNINNSSKTLTNIKFNLDLLNEKLNLNRNSKMMLQVAYTDLKMSHRFIRFSISNTSAYRDLSYKDLHEMISQFVNKDPSVVLFRLQDDNEVDFKNVNSGLDNMFKDIRGNFKLLNMNSNSRSKKSYSVSIVYDYDKNETIKSLGNNIEVIKTQNEIFKKSSLLKKNLYEVVNLTEEDIRNSQVEEILSSWVLDFMDAFNSLFESEPEQPRFLELRSNIFLL